MKDSIHFSLSLSSFLVKHFNLRKFLKINYKYPRSLYFPCYFSCLDLWMNCQYFTRFLLVICIIHLLISTNHGLESPVAKSNTNGNNIFARFHKNARLPSTVDQKKNSPSTKTDKFRLRSVILPRICYFARVHGTGMRKKLCLPYQYHENWKCYTKQLLIFLIYRDYLSNK